MALSGVFSNIPEFYIKPNILCADSHRNMSIINKEDYRFSLKSTAVPLGKSEMAVAVRHYPIVFSPGEVPVPLAVTGLLTGGNLFVSAVDGGWKVGCHVPGYLRQYPFILGEDVQGSAPLVFDAASRRLVEAGTNAGATRLFTEDGSSTRLTEDAIALCIAVQQEQADTTAFARALAEAGVLTEGSAHITLPDGSAQTIKGFATIDVRAYRALPDAFLRQWLAMGWLDAIALHLASQHNWSMLAEQFMERCQTAEVAA